MNIAACGPKTLRYTPLSTFDEALREQAHYYIQATAAGSDHRTRVLKQDDTFGVFDQYGDIDGGQRAEEGVFHKGTRFLSFLRLKLLQSRPLLLSSTVR